MKPEHTLADQILEAVAREPGCRVEELVSLFRDSTWNDVFIEVNRFSQNGRLRLMLDSEGVFTVRRTEEVGLQSFR